MRVLYLTNNADWASTTVATEGWFKHLMPRGLEPVLVSPRIGVFSNWAGSVGVPSYQLELPFPNKRWPLTFFRSLWSLRRIIRRHKINLIHCNEQDIYPIGGWLARWCGLPVLVTVHFTMDRAFCAWAFSGQLQPSRMFFLTRGSREACRLGVEGVVPESKWSILYNGLDLDRFQPSAELRSAFREQHGLGNDIVIGNACAVRPRKQLDHLFEAAARLSRPEVRVLLAGGPVPGDEAYAAELLKKAKDKLGKRLICLGHVNELRDFYNGLDLFVNTSQAEACSISIIESLACGCPVLGYPSTSVDEQVLPGGGEIVEQDRVDLLAQALERWLANPQKLEAARQQARQRAEEAFDIRKLADRLWTEYQAVVNRGA